MRDDFPGMMGGMGLSLAAATLMVGDLPAPRYREAKAKKPKPQTPTKKRSKVKAARKANRKNK